MLIIAFSKSWPIILLQENPDKSHKSTTCQDKFDELYFEMLWNFMTDIHEPPSQGLLHCNNWPKLRISFSHLAKIRIFTTEWSLVYCLFWLAFTRITHYINEINMYMYLSNNLHYFSLCPVFMFKYRAEIKPFIFF